MAKISMVGCGRLGAPVGMAWATKHDVVGYDVSSSVKEIFASRKYPHREPGAEKLIADTTMRIVDTLDDAVTHGDIVFVAVQTPHGAEYEGITRMPETRSDFDYKALCSSVALIADAATRQQKHVTLVVISTVLPGTSQQRVLPLLEGNKYVSYVYAPMFIAQTTVVEDTLHPEFVLLGVDKSDSRGVEEVGVFFETFHAREKLRFMSVASAELTKVAYNVFLGLKIVAANSIMEIAHKTGADCDEVSDALAMATDRVVSSRYMRGGMGDGGGCFVEGELIHVEDGVKAIDEIEKGDRVLGSDGMFHEVIETYRRPYKGAVYTIKGRGLARMTVTGEHPLHVAKDMRPLRADGRRDQSAGPVVGPIVETRADRVGEDCYIVFPQPKGISERESWTPPRGKSGPVPRSIVADGDAYTIVAGYFMAEGSIWYDKAKNHLPSRVTFSFNTLTDGDYVQELVRCLKEVVPGAPIRVNTRNERETCTEVRVDSTQLAKMLDHDCGHGYENKRIPAWILNDDRNSALCLRALFRGDGSSHEEGLSFSSISPHLAHGVQMMLRRHGIASTLQFHPKRVGVDGVVHRPAYDLGVNNAVYLEKLSEIVGMLIKHQMQDKRYPNTIFQRDGYWYHYVNSIEVSEYEGTVYNINVADVHNYVSVGGLVSNCHPRDQIALAWLAQKLELSYDLFGSMVEAREHQTGWLADLFVEEWGKLGGVAGAEAVILGKAYKRGTNLTVGSPALLLRSMISGAATIEHWDPYIDAPRTFDKPGVFLIATDHDAFYSMIFPAGSTIIDPWGKLQHAEGCKVIRVGRR